MVACAIQIPPIPTREEVCAVCNASEFRRGNVTARMVKGWEDRGFLMRHPAYQWPVRYKTQSVVDFLNGECK